jgi:hypothetical protein
MSYRVFSIDDAGKSVVNVDDFPEVVSVKNTHRIPFDVDDDGSVEFASVHDAWKTAGILEASSVNLDRRGVPCFRFTVVEAK